MKKFASISKIVLRLKKNKALSSFIMVVVIVNMLITASVAWFTINRQTGADDMGMGLAVDDTTAVYKVYMYDIESSAGTDKCDSVDLTVANLDLNQYDTIFKAQNKKTPAFAKIQITRQESMDLNGRIFITVSRNSEIEKTEWPSAFSSSILRFTAFIVEDKNDLDYDSANELYNFINSAKYDTVQLYEGNEKAFSKTFVSTVGEGVGHTHTKTDTITLEIEYSVNDWYENEDGYKSLNVYLYMSYDKALIDCYMDERTDVDLSIEDNTISFKNDLEKISISYVNEND